MKSPPPGREGFALFAALITMAIISAFVAGAWMIVVREFRNSAAGGSAQRAMEAAEFAATAPLEQWHTGDALTASTGSVTGPVATTLAGGASAVWRLQRLSATTFLSQGEGADGRARRAVSMLLRLALPDFDTSATLTVRDSALVHVGALVSGADAVPPAWTGLGCALSAPAAATSSPDSTHVCDGSCGGSGGVQVVGVPARLADTSVADSSRYTLFGTETWASLTARAAVRLPPNAVVTPAPAWSGGTCDRTITSNWGDPGRTSPCRDYFPVVWAAGDVTIRGGRGQGILLAGGDVTLEAGAEFTGVIVARDDVRSSSGGAHVWGRVLAEDLDVSDGRHPELASGGVIERSSCAISRATIGSAPLRRARERSWSPIYE